MQKLDLKPTRVEQTIEVGDESGYRFTVTTTWDDEFGWNGHVHMTSFGLKTSEGAVKLLQHAAEHFARMLKEAENAEG